MVVVVVVVIIIIIVNVVFVSYNFHLVVVFAVVFVVCNTIVDKKNMKIKNATPQKWETHYQKTCEQETNFKYS